jgi:hypothetical protein
LLCGPASRHDPSWLANTPRRDLRLIAIVRTCNGWSNCQPIAEG